MTSTAFHGAYAYALFDFSKESEAFWRRKTTSDGLSLEKYLEYLDSYFKKGVLSNAYLQNHHPDIPPEAYMGDFSDADTIRSATHLFDLLDINERNFTFGSSAYTDGLGDESIYSYNLTFTQITEEGEHKLWSGSLQEFANQVQDGFTLGLDEPIGYNDSNECLHYLHTVSLTGMIETNEAFDINRFRITEQSDKLSAACIQLNSFSYQNSDTDSINIPMTMSYGTVLEPNRSNPSFNIMIRKNESI